MYLAKLLADFGVDYIELVNPIASKRAAEECREIAGLGLRSKLAVHVRCAEPDVTAALQCGVDSVNCYMATSAMLRQHSHGKGIAEVVETAKRVLGPALERGGVEVRFSCEDAFRSELDEVLEVYRAVAELGVDRVGIADTVGIATPAQVAEVTAAVRDAVGPDIGINFHTHDDTGCCIANAYVALENGATHIDTSILGVGEVRAPPRAAAASAHDGLMLRAAQRYHPAGGPARPAVHA